MEYLPFYDGDKNAPILMVLDAPKYDKVYDRDNQLDPIIIHDRHFKFVDKFLSKAGLRIDDVCFISASAPPYTKRLTPSCLVHLAYMHDISDGKAITKPPKAWLNGSHLLTHTKLINAIARSHIARN